MIAITFDLSSTCIGATFVQTDDENKIIYGQTLPIIPERLDPRDYGYTTKQPKKISSKGNTYKGFLKEGEIVISKAEAERRNRELKSFEHNFLLKNIGEQCGRFLNKINPDVVALEKNKAGFNGILTTKLLAEIAGGIYFYCGAHDIALYDWDEATIRAQIRRELPYDSLEDEETGKTAIDTKWEIYCRLRDYFKREHPGIFDFTNMTMDESDALAVFYHWYQNEA